MLNTSNSNKSMIFDISYPLYCDSFIVNNEYTGSICCRCSKSCAFTRILLSNIGTTYCVADFACTESESI